MPSSTWIEQLARFGYAAKGIVYFIIGLLAIPVALGSGSKTADTSGALDTIVAQPFGKFLLALIAFGLMGYVLWRLTQALFDPEHQGKINAKRILQRLGYALSGLSYAGVSLSAVQTVFGEKGDDSSWRRDWAARLLEQPLGQELFWIVGAIAIAVGVSFLYEAYTAKFRKHFKLLNMSKAQIQWATWLGRFGISARGAAFGLIGLLVIQAALQDDPGEVQGLGGSLQALAEEPLGQWILGAIALGFMAYSLYMLIQARYRRIDPP